MTIAAKWTMATQKQEDGTETMDYIDWSTVKEEELVIKSTQEALKTYMIRKKIVVM